MQAVRDIDTPDSKKVVQQKLRVVVQPVTDRTGMGVQPFELGDLHRLRAEALQSGR